MRTLLIMCIIGVGGGIGASLRHFSGQLLHGVLGMSGYASIMVVNITGCFLIGLCFFLIEVIFNYDLESRLRPLPMSKNIIEEGAWPKNDPTQPVIRDFRSDFISEILAGFMITGILGGLTTFSVFSLLSMHLSIGGHPFSLLINIVGTVTLGVVATWLGLHLGHICYRKTSSR